MHIYFFLLFINLSSFSYLVFYMLRKFKFFQKQKYVVFLAIVLGLVNDNNPDPG